MQGRRRRFSLGAHLSLTRQVALLSLVPMLLLGVILARVLQSQIVMRTLADETESARVIAHIGIQPRLTPADLTVGMSASGVRDLDKQLSARSVTQDLARIKIWNAADRVVYSDDHGLIGRTLEPSEDLRDALAGKPEPAEVLTPERGSETASEVGLGKLVEVYVPLRLTAHGPPDGVFEIYLSYRPIAAAIARAKRTIALLVAIGLALLWVILYRIVARASRRLRAQAQENYHLAHYDPLTGLPNRALFRERVAEALAAQTLGGAAVAVLLIDVDRFREINNTLGHENGDRVLREIARRLQSVLGVDVVLGRRGGDEFAVVISGAHGDAEVLESAAVVQSALEGAVLLDGVALNVEASIGIARGGEAGAPDALLQRAEAALAYARAHSCRVQLHSHECDDFDSSRLALLGQVRAGIERGEFVLHYQPQVDLKTRRITGVEALVRWQHPEHGLMAPPSFIPLIEPTALIGPFTLALIEQALAQMVAWRTVGVYVQMSVNLSARNLLDVALPAQVSELLERYVIRAERLTLEVTESAALVDPERAVAVLAALRASGIEISVDDFGTGNASIEYLAKLPASEIKIDRSFITDILEDRRADAIVRSTLDLARNLELTVVAEGIETEAAMEHLTTLGCETGQGYYFSRPLPPDELTAQLLGDLPTPGVGGELGGSSRARAARTAG
jgi:diguanylate cyclase (GGDEF)-like protein